MEPVYLGGVRGHQSAVYKPGIGWSGAETRRHLRSRRPAVRTVPVTYRMTVARQHRPGAGTKATIVVVMATVALVLTLVLGGVVQL